MNKEIPQTPEECLSVLGITQRPDVLGLPKEPYYNWWTQKG